MDEDTYNRCLTVEASESPEKKKENSSDFSDTDINLTEMEKSIDNYIRENDLDEMFKKKPKHNPKPVSQQQYFYQQQPQNNDPQINAAKYYYSKWGSLSQQLNYPQNTYYQRHPKPYYYSNIYGKQNWQ